MLFLRCTVAFLVISCLNVCSGAGTLIDSLKSLLGDLDKLSTQTTNFGCSFQTKRKFVIAESEHATQTGNIGKYYEKCMAPDVGDVCSDWPRSKVRSIDGTCNNQHNLGSTDKPDTRLIQNAYDDGKSVPRQRAVSGQLLRSARNVSSLCLATVDSPSNFTNLMMQWGQWVAHDTIQTPSASLTGPCCGPNGNGRSFLIDENCFPIEVPPNDEVFAPGTTCANFGRSLAAEDKYERDIVPRIPVNAVTAFHDCSMIYGSTLDVAKQLRENNGTGYLMLTRDNSLPEDVNGTCRKTGTEYCLLGGDNRVNQHPYLGAINTLMVRFHNSLAKVLKERLPTASDNKIFEKTRSMVIAIHQCFTYNEWLHHVLGDNAVKYGILSRTGRTKYNPEENPSIAVEHVTAFRFGHSTVANLITLANENVPLSDHFNRPTLVLTQFHNIISGLVGVSTVSPKSSQPPDSSFVEAIIRLLFKNAQTGRGTDLPMLNIQRGRDHGLPPYNAFRQFCGLPNATGFQDEAVLGPNVRNLALCYDSIDDVDPYVGMLYEPATTGIVGPTFACIIGKMFNRLKTGDRFFFDNAEPYATFTEAQIKAIRDFQISKIFCEQGELESVPLQPLELTSSTNPMVPCKDISSLDIKPFLV